MPSSACTLNGAYPAGIWSSMTPPARCTALNAPSQTSTVPWAKLAAYRYGWPLPPIARARPLYEAPGVLAATSVAVDVTPGACGGTVGFQPVISPLSEANRNGAEALVPPADTMNCPVPLNTVPVTLPPPAMFTTSGTMAVGWLR